MTRKITGKSKQPLFLIGIGILLIVGAVIGFTYNGGFTESSNTKDVVSEVNIENIPRVELDQAKVAYDQSAAIILDVRDAEAYEMTHIKGALSFPLETLEAELNKLKKSDWIIPYCT